MRYHERQHTFFCFISFITEISGGFKSIPATLEEEESCIFFISCLALSDTELAKMKIIDKMEIIIFLEQHEQYGVRCNPFIELFLLLVIQRVY